MKIAVVSNPFAKIPAAKYGGTEVVIENLIKGLIEEGHEPILFGTGDSKVDCQIIPITEKAEFYPRDPNKLPAFRHKIKLIHKNTEKLLRKHLNKIDIIHSHGFDLSPFRYYPHVITLHNPFLLKGNDFIFNPLSISYFEERKNLNYISISKNQREGSPDLNYVANVYHGEDTDRFPIVTKPEDYVCFLGRFDADKYPHLAILLAITKGVKIKIAGKIDFEGRTYFNEVIKPYLKHPLVEYLGELGFKDKIKLLSNARCNLHPTGFREPFGLTVLEAAYCGTPTLAIERGSMPELIQDHKTGRLVEDFVEGVYALDECFTLDREYIARRARQKFNYRKMARGYIRAYRNVINYYKLFPIDKIYGRMTKMPKRFSRSVSKPIKKIIYSSNIKPNKNKNTIAKTRK